MSKTIQTCVVIFGVCAAFLYGRAKETHLEFPVTLHPTELSLGEVLINEETELEFEIKNDSAAEITIIGCESGCTCLHVAGLPIKVDPNSSRAVFAKLKPDSTGSFVVTLKVLVDKAGWVGPVKVEFNVPTNPDTQEPLALEPIPMDA